MPEFKGKGHSLVDPLRCGVVELSLLVDLPPYFMAFCGEYRINQQSPSVCISLHQSPSV